MTEQPTRKQLLDLQPNDVGTCGICGGQIFVAIADHDSFGAAVEWLHPGESPEGRDHYPQPQHPTREQLLALEPGAELRYNGMRVHRPHPTPHYPTADSTLYFSRRYLEGKLTYHANREFIEDVLPDPWELVSGELERHAAEQHAHHRDGSLVTTT